MSVPTTSTGRSSSFLGLDALEEQPARRHVPTTGKIALAQATNSLLVIIAAACRVAQDMHIGKRSVPYHLRKRTHAARKDWHDPAHYRGVAEVPAL